jgi:hypothetical protein
MLPVALAIRCGLALSLLAIPGWLAYRLSRGCRGAGLASLAVALLMLTWGAVCRRKGRWNRRLLQG